MDTSIRQRSKLRVVRNQDESLAASALQLTQYAQLLGPEHVNLSWLQQHTGHCFFLQLRDSARSAHDTVQA